MMEPEMQVIGFQGNTEREPPANPGGNTTENTVSEIVTAEYEDVTDDAKEVDEIDWRAVKSINDQLQLMEEVFRRCAIGVNDSTESLENISRRLSMAHNETSPYLAKASLPRITEDLDKVIHRLKHL